MPDTVTANYAWVKPEPHASPLDWGVKLNGNLDLIDAKVFVLNQGYTETNRLVLNKTTVAAGNPIYGQLNNVSRWVAEFGDGTAETGGDSGSNFVVGRFNDAGALIDSPFTILRANGNAIFTSFVTCQASLSAVNNININGAASAILNLCDASGVIKGAAYWEAAGGTVVLSQAGGAYIQLLTASIVLSQPTTVLGALTATATVGCKGAALITAAATTDNAVAVFYNSGGARQGYCGWLSANNIVALTSDAGSQLYLDVLNNFVFTGSGVAYKAGGGAWMATSDARVKTVINDYDGGLNDILQLHPVVYRYNGNDGDAHKQIAEEHKSFIGLVAQEAELAMPELVSYGKGTIDGVEVDDLRSLDSTPIIFALINSIKELKAEIDALKARLP